MVARAEGPELGYTATWTGDHPELLDSVLVGDDDDEESARETAQIVCESHAAKAEPTLDWGEDYPDWVSYADDGTVAYRCSLVEISDGDEDRWKATGPEGVELGTHDDLDTAQVACQSHADQIALVDSPGFGATCDAVATSKPEHELVTRSILVQLSPEEHAEAGRLHAEARKAVQHAELILAAAVEEHKTKKKHLEGVVEGKKSDADALMQPALHGEEYRELQVHEQLGPDDGTGAPRDVVYTDPETGEELDRRPATKSELQKWLPGCEPEESAPDKPPESAEAQGDEPEVPAAVERRANDDELIDELPPPGADLSWTGYQGEHGREYRAGGERQEYTICRDPGTQTKSGKGGLLQVIYRDGYSVRELLGRHTRIIDAKTAARIDNDTRIRWGVPVLGDDGEPCMLLSMPIEGHPRYQLVRQEPDAEGRDWHAERLGELDKGNTDLLAHQGLEVAQAACQADADTGRAT
jgi:hypothetical protein